jgi:hypothetical protein
MTRWANDGSGKPPRLRKDINIGTLWNLPHASIGWAPDELGQFERAKSLGFEAVQHWFPKPVLASGLRATGMARALVPEEIEPKVRVHKDLGLDATSFHLGTGFETDFEMDSLVSALIEAGEAHDYPVFLETHRATVTQDMRRTLDMVTRFPDIRFNADLSHWYTGAEMTYGDFNAKLAWLEPVFERVGFMHGRIGSSGAIQTRLDQQGPFLEHFTTMWTACFAGFLKSAQPGDYLCFAPELLPAFMALGETIHWFHYALLDQSGQEMTDRMADALLLWDIAEKCFEAARVGSQ